LKTVSGACCRKRSGGAGFEVNIVLHGSPSGEEEPAVNEQLAAAYYRVLESLAERLDLPLEIGVAT